MTDVLNTQETGRDIHGKFKPGQSGNPAGRPPNPQSFTAQLRVVLNESEGENQPTRMRAISEKLCELAKAGDLRAIALIAERLDGKPADNGVPIWDRCPHVSRTRVWEAEVYPDLPTGGR